MLCKRIVGNYYLIFYKKCQHTDRWLSLKSSSSFPSRTGPSTAELTLSVIGHSDLSDPMHNAPFNRVLREIRTTWSSHLCVIVFTIYNLQNRFPEALF